MRVCECADEERGCEEREREERRTSLTVLPCYQMSPWKRDEVEETRTCEERRVEWSVECALGAWYDSESHLCCRGL